MQQAPPAEAAMGSDAVAHADHAAHASHAHGGHADAEHSHAEHHPGGHGGHKAKHKGHDHAGHGGGHGGSWIVTYCDMITLLIAFFICILTFGSKESGKFTNPRLRDSVLYGTGGTQPLGNKSKGHTNDGVVVRSLLISANPANNGSRIPPRYSDPSMEPVRKSLDLLEGSQLDVIGDAYAARLPLAMLVDDAGHLSVSGQKTVRTIGQNLRGLPYDILIQVPAQRDLPVGLTLMRAFQDMSFVPARLGLGLKTGSAGGDRSVWLLFLARTR